MNKFIDKLRNKKGFTLIELLVVIAIIAILVLLGIPKLLGYTQKAELTRIQHDTKVMEQEMHTLMIENDDEMIKWNNNTNDFNILIEKDMLFEKEGIAKTVDASHLSNNGILDLNKYFYLTKGNVEEKGVGGELHTLDELPEDFAIYKTYKVIPNEYSDKINTKLKGTFYVNDEGKVYYEHGKPLTVEREFLANCPVASDLGYDFQIINDKGTIVSWEGTEQYLTIPPYFLLNGECVPVQVIGKGAFMRGNFKRITLPSTVQEIQSGAFDGDVNVDELIIPHTNINIPSEFTKENAVEKVIVIGELGSYTKSTFARTEVEYRYPTPSDLNIIVHPGSGTIVSGGNSGSSGGTLGGSGGNSGSSGGTLGGSGGNSGSSGGTLGGSGGTLIIPDKIRVPGRNEPVIIERLAKGAFQGEGLIEVNLPYTLERIEAYAFAGNQLTSVHIPDRVNFIGEYAFAFNEHVHSETGSRRGTIKSIMIKDHERFGNLDDYGNIKESIDGIKLEEFIFVTSIGNHVIEYEPDNGSGSDNSAPVENTGPQPSEPLNISEQKGDYKFHGEVAANELITGKALAAEIGLTAGTAQYSEEPWLKFTKHDEKGKLESTIFVAKKPLRYGLSWDQIYNAGAVYGTGTPNHENGYNPPNADINQSASVTINGQKYIVRLLSGALTNNEGKASDSGDRGAKGSEWNKMMLPIHEQAVNGNWAYPAYVEDNIAPISHNLGTNDGMYTDADLLTHYSHGNGSYSLTQETSTYTHTSYPNGYRVDRGYNGVSTSYINYSSYTFSYRGWRPALELVHD